MGPPKPQSRRDFEIALVCALRVEADAIQSKAIFDKFWDTETTSFDLVPSNDTNSYTTGVIGEHNVVLVRLPRMGVSSASGSVSSLHRSFPGIKLTLVVGICGGVPFISGGSREIHLGDLILSTAVIQYDHGRQNPNDFVRKTAVEESLAPAHMKVTGVLNKLETKRHMQMLRTRALNILGNILQDMPEAKYPGQQKDHLYRPNYQHQHRDQCHACSKPEQEHCQTALEASCEELGCGTSALLRPLSLEMSNDSERNLNLHFGRIGSGNTVMRSGLHRDKVATSNNIIAFEMEGAGAWDHGPSIVIKSVCDYADAHKNKKWQPHAAAVAAAGAKAFLEYWVPERSLNDVKKSNFIFSDIAIGLNQEARPKSQEHPVPMRKKPHQSFPILGDESKMRAFQKATNYASMFQAGTTSYVERPSLISLIEEKLSSTLSGCKIITLWGLSGTGKTQLARSYVRRNFGKLYTLCLRLQGRSHQDLRYGLAKYAKLLELNSATVVTPEDEPMSLEVQSMPDPDIASFRAMLEWLNQDGNTDWIIVIDDVEPPKPPDHQVEEFSFDDEGDNYYLEDLLNQLEQGSVILTTQHSAVDNFYPGFEIKGFDDSQSMSVIQQKIGNRCYPEKDLHSMIQYLEGHPQAIDCAASYMRTYSCGPTTYLKLWTDCDKRIFNYRPVTKGNESLAVALKVAFEKLDEQSKALLKLCAFLNSASISLDLLQQQYKTNSKLQEDWQTPTEVLDESIRRIGELSLLFVRSRSEQSSENDIVSLHPAVQKVVQILTIDARQEYYLNYAILLVGHVLASGSRDVNSDNLSDLVPHVVQCQENLKLLKRNNMDLLLETLPSVGRLGRFYHSRGQLQHAVKLYDKALRRYRALDQKPEEYYDIINSRGLASYALGNLAKAQQCFLVVLEHAWERNPHMKNLDMSVLLVRTNLALVLRDDGQLQDAKTEFEQVLAEYKTLKQGDADYYKQYRIKQYLGVTCRELGDLETAESHLLDACYGLQHVFGEQHAYVYFAKHDLATTYSRMRDENKRRVAHQTLNVARAGLLDLYGPDSLHDLVTLQSFAHLLKNDWYHTGRKMMPATQICGEFEKVALRYQEVLGMNNPLTLDAYLDWGSTAYACGEIEAAATIFRKACPGYAAMRFMPRQGYETLMMLARCIWRLGQAGQNDGMLRQALSLFNEARQRLTASEIKASTTGKSLYRAMTLERAAISARVAPMDEVCQAMLEVLSLEDLPDGQRRWANTVLNKYSNRTTRDN